VRPDLIALQERLQHVFSDPGLLERATTHRSFSAEHNERLEFLGDSVLNLAVSSLLYQRLSALPEGELSRVRANLVRQESLYQLALRLPLAQALRLGESLSGNRQRRSRRRCADELQPDEAGSGGLQHPSILADALEALIGAVYLDAGYASAQALVQRLFQDVEISPRMQAAARDAKTALQEWLASRKMKPPQYQVVARVGAAHCPTFEVACGIPALGLTERGSAGSRQAGEQAAAAAMLATLKARNL